MVGKVYRRPTVTTGKPCHLVHAHSDTINHCKQATNEAVPHSELQTSDSTRIAHQGCPPRSQSEHTSQNVAGIFHLRLGRVNSTPSATNMETHFADKRENTRAISARSAHQTQSQA